MVPEGMCAQIKRTGKRALQRFADCDVKLMLFAPSQGGKKLHKIVICIFWLPLLRSVSWASSVTEQGVLVLNSFGFCQRNGFSSFPFFPFFLAALSRSRSLLYLVVIFENQFSKD